MPIRDLIRQLDAEDAHDRAAAAAGLGEYYDVKETNLIGGTIVPALARTLEAAMVSHDGRVACAIVRSLRRFGSDALPAVPALLQALAQPPSYWGKNLKWLDDNQSSEEVLISALLAIANSVPVLDRRDWFEVFRPGIDQICGLLQHHNTAVSAVELLGLLEERARRAVPAIVKAILTRNRRDDHKFVLQATTSLALIGGYDRRPLDQCSTATLFELFGVEERNLRELCLNTLRERVMADEDRNFRELYLNTLRERVMADDAVPAH